MAALLGGTLIENPETRYAQSGDVSIAYQVVGEGDFDVVLVPSLSHVELAWTMPDLHGDLPRRLASFARLVVLDRRGMGMSDRIVGAATFEMRVDDVRAVMDAAGSRRAAFFGIYDDVATSLLFAATYPERVSALVLLAGFARTMWAADYDWGLTPAQFQDFNDTVLRMFYASRDEGLAVIREFGGGTQTDADVRRHLDYLRQSIGSPSASRANLQAQRELDVRGVLPGIRVPTLLLHGTETWPYGIEHARYMSQRIPGARLVELPGSQLIPEAANLIRMLDETEAFLREAWEGGAWEEQEPERVLATVLFTDIIDSSRRAVDLGDRSWRELLSRHHELVRRQLLRFRGKEVDTAGDGFLASFDGPARAIRCAQAIIEGVHALGLEVRAGLHTGECELLDGKVAGIAVHTGHRVASHAAPGEVLVSSTVKDLVAGSGIAFQERGVHELKGVPGEWRLYAVEPA
jgi:class 3 adenylate cyclase/pimeloyl-ACP methyl ester carboxylesterase